MTFVPITIFMPCYLRPQRTQRALNCISRQTLEKFEAIILGDDCPYFNTYILPKKPFLLQSYNYVPHRGVGELVNHGIRMATGEYFVFMGNDDVIEDDHLEYYLSQIQGTDFDFVWFNDYTLEKFHKTKLKYASVGHSNIIVRTEFLRQMAPHKECHNQDWLLIEEMSAKGKYRKSTKRKATYHIMTNYNHWVDPENID